MEAECMRTGTNIPFMPINGKYKDCIMPDGLSWWTNGFWPGMLWQMYHVTNDEVYKTAAEGVEKRLDETLHTFDKLHHDVGFMFLPSSVVSFLQTGNNDSRRRGLHAANLLAGRFNHAGNFLCAWDSSPWKENVAGWMIVDSLMNIPLLYWASKETGDPRFADIANRHAHTAMNYIVRPDGSCNHIAEFDPTTGAFIRGVGGQGYGEGSSWSRGQTWAVYGFALAYRHTGFTEYLDTAKRCAHYCIAGMAVSGWLAPVDFRAPAEPRKYDSGASTSLACGLLEIAEHVPKLEKSLYTQAAIHILQTCEEQYANWDTESDGFINGGTTMYHDERLSNMSFINGDYFFLEGILRLKENYILIW